MVAPLVPAALALHPGSSVCLHICLLCVGHCLSYYIICAPSCLMDRKSCLLSFFLSRPVPSRLVPCRVVSFTCLTYQPNYFTIPILLPISYACRPSSSSRLICLVDIMRSGLQRGTCPVVLGICGFFLSYAGVGCENNLTSNSRTDDCELRRFFSELPS